MMTHIQQHESISRETSGEGGRENVRVSKFVDLLCNYGILRRCLRRSMWEMRVIRKIKDSLRKNNITLNYAMPSSLETNQRSIGLGKIKTSIQL